MQRDTLTTGRTCVAAVGLVLAAIGCGDGPTRPHDSGHDTTADTTVTSFVSRVASADLQSIATLRPGTPPASGAGPQVTTGSLAATILGGSSLVPLQGSTAFTRVVIAVEGSSGYYELTLPSATTSTQIVVTVPQTLPRSAFNLVFGIAAASGAVGSYNSQPVNVQTVGTGDVQVSVSWDAPSDVDLHVVDPQGADIYWENPTAASGGALDLDSNAGCALDHVNNENITFPQGSAPRGRYTVRVDNWSSCGVSATKYVVTVRVSGQPVQTFSGTFTDPGDQGGAGAGTTITTFNY
jgi:hypothetical protein